MKIRERSLLIHQLSLCPGVPWAKDKDKLGSLASSATAAERARHRGDSGLVEKSIQAVCSHSRLDGQHALYLSEPFVQLQDVCPQGGPQPDCDWEGFLLKTATAAVKRC
jgi:hypothetical protein